MDLGTNGDLHDERRTHTIPVERVRNERITLASAHPRGAAPATSATFLLTVSVDSATLIPKSPVTAAPMTTAESFRANALCTSRRLFGANLSPGGLNSYSAWPQGGITIGTFAR